MTNRHRFFVNGFQISFCVFFSPISDLQVLWQVQSSWTTSKDFQIPTLVTPCLRENTPPLFAMHFLSLICPLDKGEVRIFKQSNIYERSGGSFWYRMRETYCSPHSSVCIWHPFAWMPNSISHYIPPRSLSPRVLKQIIANRGQLTAVKLIHWLHMLHLLQI